MNKPVYLGIDPGNSGAVALLDREGRVVCLLDWPADPILAAGRMDGLLEKLDIQLATLEVINAIPKQSVKSVSKQFENLGVWKMNLACHHIPFQEVTPHQWQKGLVKPSAGPDPKSRSLNVARRLFPDQGENLKRKMDHNRADALLIAEFTRRTALHGGN